ncbi:MAG: CRTAC1 family protein [Bacteroidota bacterium]
MTIAQRAVVTVVVALSLNGGAAAQSLFELTFCHGLRFGQATVLLDANGDSLLDFITANKSRIGIVLNTGSGTFLDLDTLAADNANGFGSYDLNGDGMLDFSIAQDTGVILDNWINLGNTAFATINSGNESIGSTRNVVYADLDNDGFVDSYHSASAFSMNREANQLHQGLPNGLFGPDIMEQVMPGFFYDSLIHPTLGPQYWSSLQSKGAVVRDLDGDGFGDIINAVYCDLGFQPDSFTVQWVNQQKRGLFILRNTSTPGTIGLTDVSLAALGPDANGAGDTVWNAYAPVPLDYDRDGDYDLIVGATTRRQEDTDLVRLYENVSTPGQILFVERTVRAGLQGLNDLPVSQKRKLNFAAGAALDYDNDGFLDVAFVNRVDAADALEPYVHLFRNNGDGTLTQVPYAQHNLGLIAGGRDINGADLDNDGRQDILLSDGSVGGYEGTDSTLVYMNRFAGANRWVQIDRRTTDGGSWAFDYTVEVFRHRTDERLGMDDIRTDFCYRSKRSPVLHFGLGAADRVDVMITKGAALSSYTGLPANQMHRLDLPPVPYGTGWNLVSVPTSEPGTTPDIVFPERVGDLYRYRGGYEAADTLEPGEGYWVKLPAAVHRGFWGLSVNTDTTTLVDGWNLVGGIARPVPTDSVGQNPPGALASPFFNFEPAHGYEPADTLFPGSGYWVKSNGTSQIVLK